MLHPHIIINVLAFPIEISDYMEISCKEVCRDSCSCSLVSSSGYFSSKKCRVNIGDSVGTINLKKLLESTQESKDQGKETILLSMKNPLKTSHIFAVNIQTMNCTTIYSQNETTTQETTTIQDFTTHVDYETTTQSKAKNISARQRNGPKINLIVVVGLCSIIILQAAGLIYLKKQNSMLSLKAKNQNSICLQNIPPAAPVTTVPDREEAEGEEINEMYGQTGEPVINCFDYEQQYCEM